ncbi:MAG: ABC transporter permease [Clostridia bacterium]|nr:ABC transporter permease [Clostridia bacterium]
MTYLSVYLKVLKSKIKMILIYGMTVYSFIVIMTCSYQKLADMRNQNMLKQYQFIQERYLDDDMMKTSFQAYNEYDRHTYYFSLVAFSTLSVLATEMALLLYTFDQGDLKRRIMSAPVSNKQIRASFYAIGLLMSFVLCFVQILLSFCIFGINYWRAEYIFMIINMILLSFVGLELSNVVAKICKNRKHIGMIITVLIIAVCFLSGVFVPQYLLGKSAKTIAVFMPVYWYIHANNIISDLYFNDLTYLPEILKCFIIQIFSIVLLHMTASVIEKQEVNLSGGLNHE